MQKISISIALAIAALTISVAASAQRIDIFSITLPPTILDGGGSVYVKSLTNNGTEVPDFGDKYAESLTTILKRETYGMKENAARINPWQTTKLYQIAESETEADFIIGGEYKFEFSSKTTIKEMFIKEAHESLKIKLPASFYHYFTKNEASLEGKMVITKKDGSIFATIPFAEKKYDSGSSTLPDKPKVKSASSFLDHLTYYGIDKPTSALVTHLKNEGVKFKNLKTKNKEIKNEYKDLDKQVGKLIKANDVNGAGKVLFQIATLEESENVFYNIAACYEAIGNYTKAKEYYDKSGDKSGIKRINEQISTQDKLKSLGISITENEL